MRVRILPAAHHRLVPAAHQLELEARERLGQTAERVDVLEAVGERPQIEAQPDRAGQFPRKRVERRLSGLEPAGELGGPSEGRIHQAAPVVQVVLLAREREPRRGLGAGVDALRRLDGIECRDPLAHGVDGGEVPRDGLVGDAPSVRSERGRIGGGRGP